MIQNGVKINQKQANKKWKKKKKKKKKKNGKKKKKIAVNITFTAI